MAALGSVLHEPETPSAERAAALMCRSLSLQVPSPDSSRASPSGKHRDSLGRTLSLNAGSVVDETSASGSIYSGDVAADIDILVSFFCSAKRFIHDGCKLYVLGSLDCLGKWDVAKALPLSEEGSLHLVLHRDQLPFEFKFIVRRGDKLIWQKGANYAIHALPMRVSQSVQFYGGEVTTEEKVPLTFRNYDWSNYQGLLRTTEDAQVVWEATGNVCIDAESRLGRMVQEALAREGEARQREGNTRFDLRLALMESETEREEIRRSERKLVGALGRARGQLSGLLGAFDSLRASCEELARARAADAEEMAVLRAALARAEAAAAGAAAAAPGSGGARGGEEAGRRGGSVRLRLPCPQCPEEAPAVAVTPPGTPPPEPEALAGPSAAGEGAGGGGGGGRGRGGAGERPSLETGWAAGASPGSAARSPRRRSAEGAEAAAEAAMRASREHETVRIRSSPSMASPPAPSPPAPPPAPGPLPGPGPGTATCPATALLPAAGRPPARRALLPPEFFAPPDLAARLLN
eukprot:tig00000042_g15490.t1